MGKWHLEKKPVTVFSLILLFFNILFWVVSLITRSSIYDVYFFSDHTNSFMDFYNMLYEVRFLDPYGNGAQYPALCFLILRLIMRILPNPSETVIENAIDLRVNSHAVVIFVIFIMVLLIIIWEVTRFAIKGNNLTKVLFGMALFTSGPMLYLLERGNMLIIALAFSLLFLVMYDSEDISCRRFSYICLSIAAAIKIYPCVFALLVLKKKRYKELIELFIVGCIVFFVPFFFFDGIESIKSMINGFSLSTGSMLGRGYGYNYSLDNLAKIVFAMFGIEISNIPLWFTVLIMILCMVLFFLAKKEWQQVFMLTLMCILVPTYSYTYTLTFFFLPIISFFSKEEVKTYLDKIYAGLLMLFVIPYCLPFISKLNSLPWISLDFRYYSHVGGVKFPISYGSIVIYVAMIVICLLILVEHIVMKEKSNENNFNNDSNI